MSMVALAVAIVGWLLAVAQPAGAQSLRTFVSALGNDSSANCASTAPCRTFAGALAKTSPGGEITVLDSGDFGPVTIDKSVSIIAEGVDARLEAFNAITVNSAAGDVVVLRGLTVDGTFDGSSGIRLLGSGVLHVQKCVIKGFAFGLRVFSAPAAELYVSDTQISRNAAGVDIRGEAQPPKVLLERVQIENNAIGLFVSGRAAVTVRDSVAAGNGAEGFRAGGNTIVFGEVTRLLIERSAAVNNGTGISSRGSPDVTTVTIADSTITGNGTGLAATGGAIASFGNNRIAGNGTDGAPTTTVAPR
jgi:hypothetical protein